MNKLPCLFIRSYMTCTYLRYTQKIPTLSSCPSNQLSFKPVPKQDVDSSATCKSMYRKADSRQSTTHSSKPPKTLSLQQSFFSQPRGVSNGFKVAIHHRWVREAKRSKCKKEIAFRNSSSVCALQEDSRNPKRGSKSCKAEISTDDARGTLFTGRLTCYTITGTSAQPGKQ